MMTASFVQSAPQCCIAVRPKSVSASAATPLGRLPGFSRRVPMPKAGRDGASREASAGGLESYQPFPASKSVASEAKASKPACSQPFGGVNLASLVDCLGELARLIPTTLSPVSMEVILSVLPCPSKPVAIPRLNSKSTIPFARALAPQLEQPCILQCDG